MSLSQHVICLGKTFKMFSLGCEVEAISKMYVKALSIGNTPILSDQEMDKVIKQMENELRKGLAKFNVFKTKVNKDIIIGIDATPLIKAVIYNNVGNLEFLPL